MVLPTFVRQALLNEPVTVYGSGEQSRCFGHVSDIIDGLLLLLNCERASGEIFNLGGATPVTLTELVAAIEKATGRTAILDRQPSQPGDVPVTYAAVEKARRLLGFRARVPLAEGLRRSVDWYRRGRSGAGRQPAA